MKAHMNKTVLAIGVVLMIAGGLCLGIGILFHWVAVSTMDGSTMFYGRMLKWRYFFAILGTVLLLIGIALLAVGLTMKAR